nr:ChuX/HutX family heme-like substrate-binding protein [Snodgrassella sp.]
MERNYFSATYGEYYCAIFWCVASRKKGVGDFNLQHNQGFSGNICMQNCVYIAFVVRSFMLMATAAIIFLNWQGETMFKIFVGRNKKRPLKVEHLSSLAQHFGAA